MDARRLARRADSSSTSSSPFVSSFSLSSLVYPLFNTSSTFPKSLFSAVGGAGGGGGGGGRSKRGAPSQAFPLGEDGEAKGASVGEYGMKRAGGEIPGCRPTSGVESGLSLSEKNYAIPNKFVGIYSKDAFALSKTIATEMQATDLKTFNFTYW